MPIWLTTCLLIGLSLNVSGQSELNDPTSPSSPQVDFFEREIRPVLIEHCYECHSSATEKSGGLWVDSRDSLRLGGDSGAAVVPGDLESSSLWKAISYADTELQMPPDGKLHPEVIEAFRRWILEGAVDPREAPSASKPSKSGLSVSEAQDHWAYRPLTRPKIPSVNSEWPSDPIDRFVMERLSQVSLRPAPQADARVLLRRLYFDLHGIPPSREEIEDFVNDSRPDAYERVVDRLLTSPRFAERFARRWLDSARYADSLTLRGFVLPQAWRYRNYVVDSIAEDRPWDQWITEQIAGDLLPSDDWRERARNQIATTFLVLGNSNLEEQDKKQLEMDIVDEQLDTIGRVFLGQTLGCARCHDHKFDPIPTSDYYAMAGILKGSRSVKHANVSEWLDRPLPLPPDQENQYSELTKQVSSVEQKLSELRRVMDEHSKGKSIVDLADLRGVVVDDSQAKKVGIWKDSTSVRRFVASGYVHDDHDTKQVKTLTFEPNGLPAGTYEVRISYAEGDNRATNATFRVFSADGEKDISVNQKRAPTIDNVWYSLGTFRFEAAGQAYVMVSNESADGHVIADAVQFLPVDLVSSEASIAADNPPEQLESLSLEIKSLEQTLKELKLALSRRPSSMTVEEQPPFDDLAIHIRGSVHQLGKIAPRGFMQVALLETDSNSSPDELLLTSKTDSGRRYLAECLTSQTNPLTRRVLANRVWSWLLGEGIVSSVDNFGTTGTPPTHPELLDYLANELSDNEWSLKHLVRKIVLSKTYQMDVDSPEATRAVNVDPDNRLLWRANRKRLDAEQIRDTILLLSGELSYDRVDRPFPETLREDYGFKHTSVQRSIYLPIFRNSLPELFELFDFADPSVSVGKRNQSIIAPQALWFLNDTWLQERSEQWVRNRPINQSGDLNDEVALGKWIDLQYESIFGYPSTEADRTVSLQFLREAANRCPPGSDRESFARACWLRALVSTIDFRYIK